MRRARVLFVVGSCSVTLALSFIGCSSQSDTPAGSGQAGQAGAKTSGQAGSSASGRGGSGGLPSSNGQSGASSGATSAGGSPGNSGSGGTAQAGASTGGSSSSAGHSGAGTAGAGTAGAGTAGAGTAGAGTAGAGTAGAGTAGAGTGGAGGTNGMSSGCGKPPTIASNMYNNGKNIPITAASMQRRYILSVPTNYSNAKPYKLVIAWHQRDGNDNQMYANKYYHLQPLSNDTTIFVAPNGQQNGAPCTGSGNGETGCGWPNHSGSDMALADAVVSQIEENFCIDTNRIFATGWSYGGSMSYETACQRPLGGMVDGKPGFIRAIAVYSGSQLSGSCTPSKPVGYYASHGSKDSVLCYDDTKAAGCQVGNGLLLAQNFAKANGCTWMTPTKVTSGNHVCTTLTGCMTGYPEQFCSFNGDHTPDPSDGGGTSWEYQNAWNFLNQF